MLAEYSELEELSANTYNIDDIVVVNDSIRKIVTISRKVYIIALNAMFMARKTDGMASGFGSVTTELREFSDRLDGHMKGLSVGAYELLVQVAKQLKRSRDYRYFSRTRSELSMGINIDIVDDVLEYQASQLEGIRHDFDVKRNQVRADLEKAKKLCDTGENLAVLAKIESVGAGGLSESLMQVAEQIGSTINEIQSVLREAISCIEGRGGDVE